MAYPDNTSMVLAYLGFESLVDFIVSFDGTTRTLDWTSGETEPTEQEIIDVEESQAYLDWYAEHGGNALLTFRRKAKEAMGTQRDVNTLVRAALLALVDELNKHANKHNEILDAVDAAISLSDLQTRVGAIMDYPQRTGAQLKSAALEIIDDGDADT